MGNWFENMEPMNIQEERAKTKKAEESSLAPNNVLSYFIFLRMAKTSKLENM